MFGNKNVALERLSTQIETLAAQVGQLKGERSLLDYEQKIDQLHRQKTDLEIEIDKVREQYGRQEREIEHKLGLHRTQIESERTIMLKEAEAERIRAVDEAKLAVRESNLDAERKRFEQEIEFRTKRFEEEAATLRDLTGQILARLPNVTASFTQHIGPEEPKALEKGD